MSDPFDEFRARVGQLLADPERVDPARLAHADQAVRKMREHWDGLVEVTRPLLHGGMGHVELVDFVVTAAADVGLYPEDMAALVGPSLIRSYETARRRA